MVEAMIAAAAFLGMLGVLHRKNSSGAMPVRMLAWALVFAVYAAGVAHFTILHRDVSAQMRYELALFWSYKIAWEEMNLFYWEEIVYNILLFVPLGILLPLLFERFRKMGAVLLLGASGSLLIEMSQLLLRIGLFEFDDIFNNVLGAMLGCCAWAGTECLRRRENGWKRKALAEFLPIIVVAFYFGVFYYRISGGRV